jgi:hypothetical protein
MAGDNRWTDSKKHPFVVRVEEANERCGISDEVFKQWQTDAMNSFTSRNAYALSIDRVQDGPIESRTLINLVDSMKGIVQSHGVSINLMSTSINVMTANLAKLTATIAEMTRVQNLSLSQREILQPDKEHDENATAKAITLSSTYSQLMRTGKETPLLDIAFYWFRYNTLQLYLNEKSTVATKKIGNRLRQHFSSIKTTMNVIIKNLDNYPDEVPSDPTKIVPWERSLKAEVNAALERIKPHVKSLNKNNVKELVAEYKDIDFPEGTPEDVKVFFNDKGRNQGGRSKRPADESVALDSSTNKRQRSI